MGTSFSFTETLTKGWGVGARQIKTLMFQSCALLFQVKEAEKVSDQFALYAVLSFLVGVQTNAGCLPAAHA